MSLVVRNPATGETLATLDETPPKEVEAAVARARAAQAAWATRTLDERARVVRAFRATLLARRREVAELVTRETGKPLTEAFSADVLPCLDAAAWVATNGPKLLRPRAMRLSNPLLAGRTSRIEREPLGVVGIVSPWNYPLSIPGSQLCYALLAGNAVVLKPASYAPLTALKLRELWTAAGLPEDVFVVVPGGGRVTGQALVEADIDYLLFTGSVPVGKEVERRLRERNVASCMELGGNDPAVVLEDADLARAVRGVAWARFANAGQTCAAAKRLLVHRSLHDRFVADLVAHVSSLRLGDPMRPETDVGPLTDPASVAEMQAMVDDARKRGARVLCGGRARPDLGPQFFEPTVLVDVPADARVLREETFGPLLPVVPFETEDEAVRLANDTPFGLSASVWTRDVERGLRVGRRIHAGTVVVNDALYTYAANETPWGGFRDSGHGRTHGAWGLEEMTRLRHLNAVPPSAPLGSPWWFPYDASLRDALEKGAAVLYGTATEKARHAIGTMTRLLPRRK